LCLEYIEAPPQPPTLAELLGGSANKDKATPPRGRQKETNMGIELGSSALKVDVLTPVRLIWMWSKNYLYLYQKLQGRKCKKKIGNQIFKSERGHRHSVIACKNRRAGNREELVNNSSFLILKKTMTRGRFEGKTYKEQSPSRLLHWPSSSSKKCAEETRFSNQCP